MSRAWLYLKLPFIATEFTALNLITPEYLVRWKPAIRIPTGGSMSPHRSTLQNQSNLKPESKEHSYEHIPLC